MKSIRVTLVLLIATGLSGCAATMEQYNATKAEALNTIPTCQGEEDCRAKWEAAQLWIVKNARYKIQTATSVLIQTFNPTDSTTYIGATVTKEPLGGGKYKIIADIYCDNIFGCNPPKYEAMLDFNRYVGAMTP